MARKPMMAGNWKMNNAIGEAVVLTQEISNNWWKDWEDKVDVVICPPFVDLKPVKTVLEFDKTKIFVGAQNVYWEEAGAFTGEVSVPMIRECGCDYCIVGHSERRGLFGETNEDVNKKVRALLGGRLKPIVCVGESLAVRDEGTTNEYVCAQVKAAFASMRKTPRSASSPTSPFGPSAPAVLRPPSRQKRCVRQSVRSSPFSLARKRHRPCASSTVAR